MVIIPVAREISSMSSLTHRTFGRFSWRLSYPLDNILWSCLNDSEAQERGLYNSKISRGRMPPDPIRSLRLHSLRKQTTLRDATNGFPANWSLRNERRNSILGMMTNHYPDLNSASDWLKQVSHASRPIRSTTQIWVVTRYQYGISALASQTSIRGETVGGVAHCRLFSQANAFSVRLANRSVFILDPNLDSAVATRSSYNSTWS